MVYNPKTNRTAMQCPMEFCPKACGVIEHRLVPNPNKTKGAPKSISQNFTVCNFAWFTGACSALAPPLPPKPPPKKITSCPINLLFIGGVCVPVAGPGHAIITVSAC
jgi:hypothetical protein